MLGVVLPVSSWYQEFGGIWQDRQAGLLGARGGYDIVVCWELHGIVLADLLDGRYDGYITEYVRAAGRYPGHVVLRPLHEANGNWYDWAPAAGRSFTDGAKQVRQAWRHLVAVARSAHQSNVSFFWCMNADDVGGISMEEFWPGADHVDLLGVDAFRRDGAASFEELFAPAYGRLVALDDRHEIWLGETGSHPVMGGAAGRPGLGAGRTGSAGDDPGGDGPSRVGSSTGSGAARAVDGAADRELAGYLRAMYTSQQFPRLRTVIFFHQASWRVDATASTVAVHRAQLPRAPQYGGRVLPAALPGAPRASMPDSIQGPETPDKHPAAGAGASQNRSVGAGDPTGSPGTSDAEVPG